MEREKKEEEEKLEKEEEEKRKTLEEEEKKREEEEAIFKSETIKKMNKKEEDLTQEELTKIEQDLEIKKRMDGYEKIKYREFDYQFEGKDIRYNLEEIKQISTDQVINLEITNSGKIIAITEKKNSKFSTLTIYKEKTYEIEKRENLKNRVNSFKIFGDKIYCTLGEIKNILIISLDNFDDKIELTGHSSEVKDLAYTACGYLISADIGGNILVWKDNKVLKSINDFKKRINTISEIDEKRQRIAILSFNEEQIKFYELKYTCLEPMATVSEIKGSGFQNNMIKLNQNMLAIAGTYLYIVDTNSFVITNVINCIYANDCISISLSMKQNKGYYFVGQAMTNKWDDNLEKGTIGFYEYIFNNFDEPDDNPIIKVASKNHCHDSFITSIRRIDDDTVVSGAYDGKIKLWKIKDI